MNTQPTVASPRQNAGKPHGPRMLLAGGGLLVLIAAASPAAAQFGEINPGVEIIYDNSSLPHIFSLVLQPGKADKHVFYGLGYQQMRDFPVQTLDNIFSSCGRYAEAWGDPTAANPNEALDRFLHHWELPDRASERISELDEDDPFNVLPLLQAYVDGVNDGRSWWLDHPAALEKLVGTPGCTTGCELFIDPVPVPLVQWNGQGHAREALEHFLGLSVTLQDVVAAGFALNSSLYAVLAPGSATPTVVLPGSGTNSWVARTAAGGTLMMNDSHLNFIDGRVGVYPVQMSGGNYKVTGVSVPGFPCVVIGFNQNLAWATSVGGNSRIPNPAETQLAGLSVGAAPVVSNTWHATLESGTPLRFPFGTESAVLEARVKTFKVWDGPGTSTFATREETMWYAPAEANAVVNRYPLLVDDYTEPMDAPAPGQAIRFQQRAPLFGASAWEHMIAMGLAQSTACVVSDVLPYARYGFGRALNLLVADRFGDLHYSLMAFVPQQGSGALVPWEELDGTQPNQRWTRIHPPDEMPRFDSASGGEEVWIACNTSADFVGPALTQSFPSYILEETPTGTWRQERADELLRGPASPAIDRAVSESSAMDVQDAWIAALWPLFEETYEQRLTGVGDVTAFVEFVNENKLEGGTIPFLATQSSRVTVYTTLLRDEYELDILEREDCGESNPPGCLTVPQKRLGFDPAFELPSAAAFGSSGNWVPNLDAMEEALIQVAGLYVATASGADNALDNVLAVSALDSVLTAPLAVNPTPWAALLDQEPLDVRWGMVNVLSTTPHAIPFSEADEGCGFFLAAYLSNFYPPMSPGGPFFSAQRPAVWPLAGVRDSSLFAVNSLRPSKAVYPCTGTKNLFFTKLQLGSVAPISVEFPAAGGPPQASFLSALGATSHVRAISEFGIGAEDRWLPTAAFANRTWQTLHMQYAYLDQPANNIYRFTVMP